MAEDEATVTLSVDGGVQVVRFPEGWRFPGSEVRLRRVGDAVVVEPVLPLPHPSWPPGYWEWLEDARARGDFGDFDPDDIRLRELHLHDPELDDSGRDEPG